MKTIFKTKQHVFIFPSSGTGGWEAALVNTVSPGDKVLMFETGRFAALWNKLAQKIGAKPELLEGGWRGGAGPDRIEARLRQDTMLRSYWDWHDMVGANATGYLPCTPGTGLLYGLTEAINMLHEEGLGNVFARHARRGAATRVAVRAWG